ncbi:enoyl-CoA hydratase-related protein [Streptomyces mirabilis]|nr:enoyl-CoA hydratase-related protein [Streptomyces mirabilis]
MAGREPVVLVDVEERIATVTLNRPEARNALSREVTFALWDAVTAAGKALDVDAVILTGADPAFCAGVDLKEVSGVAADRGPRAPGQGRSATPTGSSASCR